MSVTIDSLDIQIRSSAGSAAKNIEDLAKALGNLNANAKVTKVVNSLNNLNTALSNMKSQQAVMSQLSALSRSLSGLASIPKLTGLQSAIRELKKLPEVMESLDTAQIAQFTGQMKLLASGLAPLATQIDKISKGFSKLPPQVSKCVTAVKRLDQANKSVAKSTSAHAEALNAQSINLLAAYENLSNVFSIIHGIQDAFAAVLNDAIQWDGIQFQFGRAFGEDAEIVLEYAEKVSKTLRINKQQFMESASLYGSLLKGFGVEQKQVTTMAVGLAELSYDIWAAYNNRYKTLDDASEAVRSAITGEIEPIRNAGIALTEASMQEFADGYDAAKVAANDTVTALENIQNAAAKASGEMEGIRKEGEALASTGNAIADMVSNGISDAALQATADTLGLGMSVEKMTEAQKSELRYATMINAARNQGIIGTYAREMETAEGAVRTLSQQLKSLGQAFGSLFIPILKATLPWITAFVELITEGVIALGALFGIKFQEITWGNSAATGMAQTAEGANATKEALGDAAKEAKKIKDYTMGFDELNIISPDTGADDAAGGGAGGGAAGGGGGGGLGLDLDTLWDEAVFASASKQIDDLKQKIKDYVAEHKVMLGIVGSIAGFLTLAKAIRGLNALFGITKTWGNLVTIFGGISSAATKISGAFGNVKAFFDLLKGGSGFIPTLAAAFPNIANAVSSMGGFFGTAAKAVGAFVGGLTIGPILTIVGIVAAIASVVVFLKNNWEEVTNAVKGFFETNIVPKLESIKDSWEEMKAALPEGVIQWFKDAGVWIGNLVAKVVEWFKSVEWLDAIGKAFEVVGGVIFSVIGGGLAAAFSTVIQVVKGVIKWFSGFVEVISGFIEFWIAVFSGDNVMEPIKKIFDGVVDIFEGLYDVTIGVVVNFVKSIIDWFTELWDELVGHSIVPDMVKAIIDWFLSLPSKILQPIKNFCTEVKEKFQKLWSDVKSWWSANVAPKFTLAYWKNKFDVIKQGVATKLEEVKTAIASKWTTIKGWFTQNVLPKFTLSFWLDKFKNLKTGFTQTIKNAVNGGIDLMNKFIGWINEKLGFSWDAVKVAGKEIVPAGNIQLFTIPKIPRFETGGFLEDGLFTMNHGEIAGKFNNGKSVVANNQQIVEGIAAGVYEAVVSAMNATSGRSNEQNVNVYLDGKQIYSSMKKAESERGLSIMGNQLGYAY